MNPKVLSPQAWAVVKTLDKGSLLESWILAGGTALALQLGHRISLDLDFFIAESFEPQAVRAKLAGLGELEVQTMATDSLHVRLDGVRLSYLRSEVPFLYEPVEYRGLRLAELRDITAMKVIAVAGRGSKKDFVDLYAYLEAGGTFPELMRSVRKRYRDTKFNEMHLLRSLVYFDDAEDEPMPRMLSKAKWDDIRLRIEEEVRHWAP